MNLYRLDSAEEAALVERLLTEHDGALFVATSGDLPPALAARLGDRPRLTLANPANGRHRDRPPLLDDDGILRFHDAWVALSPVEQTLGRLLLDQFGGVVPRDRLIAKAWPGGFDNRNLLDVQMLRLRRRVGTVGLEIRTVRSRGYLLQEYGRATDAAN